MKSFDIEWMAMLRDVHRFVGLSPDVRRVLLTELKTSGSTVASRFGLQLEAIVASGIASYDSERDRVALVEERRTLLKLLRAMWRHQLFDNTTIHTLAKYMEEHCTQTDIDLLWPSGAPGYSRATRPALAPHVASPAWAGDFLDADSDRALLTWAAARGRSPEAGTSLEALRATQTLARTVRKRADAVPLYELIAQLEPTALPAFARTLFLGLDTLVLFVGLRGADFEPMVGLWPTALSELRKPPAAKPTAVVPEEEFELAVLMEDMTALLAAIVSSPIRVRNNDLAVFVRARTEIEARLTFLPDWAVPLLVSPAVTRVDAAANALRLHGFVSVQVHNQQPHLQSVASGAKWLALSPRDRLASLIAPMRDSKLKNPTGSYGEAMVEFFSFSMPYYHEPKGLNLRECVTRAFLDLPKGFVLVEPFLEHAAREANPFLALSAEASRQVQYGMYYGGGDPRQAYRSLWRNALVGFLSKRLLGLGGAILGRTAHGELCFALTDVGRYLLGAIDQFAYGSASTAEVVVQPNFDVVFLGAAPSVEARLARVADRVGVSPGLVFRITRASVLRAAESGITADEVLATLSAASSKPVPKNVQREIVGWVATVRRARLRAMHVVECDTVEAADRIASVLGAKAQRLTPTLFELSAATAQARLTIIKRLRAGGVFIDDQVGNTDRSPKRRPRGPVWDEGDFE